jgi:hypothetical protein
MLLIDMFLLTLHVKISNYYIWRIHNHCFAKWLLEWNYYKIFAFLGVCRERFNIFLKKLFKILITNVALEFIII